MYPTISLPLLGQIPTFFLVISLAIVIGMTFLFSRNGAHSLSQNELSNLNLVLMISAFLGGRLFHVLYEEPVHYLHDPLSILAFWNGGFVFYGGLLLAVASGLFYLKRVLKKNHQEILLVLDFYAPAAALTYAIGRIGCFLNGCCFGRADTTWISVQGKFPIQLATSGLELIIFFSLLTFAKFQKLRAGSLFFLWLSLHALNRIFMESQRDDFRGPVFLFSVSTWISFFILVTAIVFLGRLNKK